MRIDVINVFGVSFADASSFCTSDISCALGFSSYPSTGLEEEEREAGDATDVDATRKTRSAVVRTSTRQTIFLPVPGLVDPAQLKPSDLVGTNKESYLILEKLPAEFDSRVQAMEVDERPTEEYSDIGGADQQIQELIEAVVLPMTHKDMYDTIGIRPPKGVLLRKFPRDSVL
jgi:26S proteasome regulatory subunit T5